MVGQVENQTGIGVTPDFSLTIAAIQTHKFSYGFRDFIYK
jgi:hypothetical protein